MPAACTGLRIEVTTRPPCHPEIGDDSAMDVFGLVVPNRSQHLRKI